MPSRYSVLVVGGRGAGKTVYLASLFRCLSVSGPAGFTLETDARKRLLLNEIYARVANPDDEWPDANSVDEVSEWEFDVRVAARDGRKYTACAFVYYDYAGGRITRADLQEERFQDVIRNADCLLGIIDGGRLLDWMNGVDPGGQFQNVQMPALCQLLEESSCPAYIIVTKWDLFTDSPQQKYSLDDVRNRLIEHDLFKGLVRGKQDVDAEVRLIPVSSVGSGFAIRQPDGTMKKTGKAPQPFQVEMPFACVLPDRVEQELRKILQERIKILEASTYVDPNLTFWDRLRQSFGGVVRVLREVLPQRFQYAEGLLKKFADSLERSVADKTSRALRSEAQRRAEREASLSVINDEKSALEYAVGCFHQMRDELDHYFPASRVRLPRS